MDQPYQQNQPEEVSNVPANIPNLSSDAPNTPPANSNVPPAYPHAPAENPFASPVFQNPACVPPVTRIRQTATGRDVVFAILCAIFCILCADNYLWGGASLGASLSTVCLLLTGIIYLGRYARKVPFYGIICLLLYLACAVSLSFTDVAATKVLTILTMIPLSAAAILEFMDIRVRLNGDFRSIADIFYTVFVLTFGKIGNTFYALFHKKDCEGNVSKRRAGSVILGLVLSLPALLIIIPLLKSSDAAFSNLIDQFSPKNFFELIGAGMIGLILFILLFGRMLAVPNVTRQAPDKHKDSGAEPALVITFLSVISVVFLLYLFSQLSYFFSAFSGLLPKNFTVAEYARRGFFEMTAVCAINLLIIFLANLICRKKEGKAPLSVRLLSVFFCVFSLVLAATSLSKLFLYIQSFGMTHLRIITSVFVVFLAVIFITVLFRLFFKKIPYIKVALAAAALLLTVTAFVNVDRVIAKYNIEAYLSGTLDSIDMDTLHDLDSNATAPYLLKLVNDKNRTVSRKAQKLLTWQARDLFEIENGKIVESKSELRSWNLCDAKAEKLLEDHFDEYYMQSLCDDSYYGWYHD